MANNNEDNNVDRQIILGLGQDELAQDLINKWMEIVGEPLLDDDAEQDNK
jgi:hypothetical protein